MNKCILYAVLFVGSCIGLSGVFSSTASAASPYDHLIQPVTELKVKESFGTEEDITVSWGGILQNVCGYTLDFEKPYAVVQSYNGIGIQTWEYLTVHVYQGEIGQEIVFSSTQAFVTGTIDYWEISQTSSGYSCFNGTSGNMPIGFPINESGNGNQPLLSTFDIDYPIDYEGEIIPDTVLGDDMDRPAMDLQPEFVLKVSTGGMVNVRYSNNLDWDITGGATISVTESDSGCSASTILGLYTYDTYEDVDFNFQLENTGWFKVSIVTSDEGINPWSACFNWEGKEISLGSVNCGIINDFYTCREMNYEDVFNQCIDSDFPFIHFQGCMKAFSSITEGLSFGAIRPLDNFRFETITDCRQLNVLGSWINQENTIICPAVSQTVRNTVTPFIAFGLSLTVLGFIVNRTAKDFQ